MKHFNIPIFIPHLGCPYECIYCDQRVIAAQLEIPEPRQVNHIIEEHLQTIPEAADVEVAFFGGSFTAISEQQQEGFLLAVQPFLQQGRVRSIRISTRPDCIKVSNLELLQHYGVKLIELGVQSMSREVLRASRRNYEPEDVQKSCHLIKAMGFDLGIQLMIGLPGDTYQRDLDTTHAVITLQPQIIRLYPTLVIAGTALEFMWRHGQYRPLDLDEAVATCADMFLLLQKENIKVIRMGLYPGEDLRRDGVVKAGPFHSSFGELVEQQVFKEQARAALEMHRGKYGHHASIRLYVNFRDISKMTGHRKASLQYLRQEFALQEIHLTGYSHSDRNWIGVGRVESDTVELMLTRPDFIKLLSHN